MKKIKIIISLLIFTSCSSSINRRESLSDMHVKVSVDGKSVDDIEQQLIHRVELKSAKVNLIKSGEGEQLNLPFLLKKEIDHRGLVMGLRVIERGNKDLSINDFGLRDKDLITAIGTKLVASAKDFELFVDVLKGRGEISVTVEREFQPHKIMYYLVQ